MKNQRNKCYPDERLVAFADGEAIGTQRRQIDAHLADCADCRNLVTALSQSHERLIGFGKDIATIGLTNPAEVSRSSNLTKSGTTPRQKTIVIGAAAIAATVLVAFAISQLLMQPNATIDSSLNSNQVAQRDVQLTDEERAGEIHEEASDENLKQQLTDSQSAIDSIFAREQAARLERSAQLLESEDELVDLARQTRSYLSQQYNFNGVTQ